MTSTHSDALVKAILFLLVTVAVADDATCAPSSPGCPSKTQADANTLLQKGVRIGDELAPGRTDEKEKNTHTDQAAASAHGTETLGENKTRQLGSLLMMTNATAMLAEIQEVARSGEAPAFDQVQQIKTLLEGMSAILQTTREAAATATTDALDDVQLCNTQWDTHFAKIQAEFTTVVTGPTSQRSVHKQCRLDQKNKYDFNLTHSNSSCFKLGTLLHDIKEGSSDLTDYFKDHEQRSDMVGYVKDASISKMWASYVWKPVTITSLDADCTSKEGELADKKVECNGKQGEFQQGFCAIKTKLEDQSDTLDECYKTSVAAYNKHVTDTQKLVVKWNIEEVTVQKIVCFCDVWLADTDTADKDTAGNDRSQVNQTGKFEACNALAESHVTVDYGQVDPKAAVNLTSVSNHPGQSGFITEENGFLADFYEPVAACMEAKATCNLFTTCSGLTPLNKGANIMCSGDAASCNEATCCEATTTAEPTTQAPTTAEPTTVPEARALNSWASISTTGGPPVARYGHTAIYSVTENTMYVFGGQGRGIDVWALNLTTKTWASISTTGGPPRHYHHTAIYSATENTMYVFGGHGRGNDVWALNLATKTWASISTTGGPPVARYLHTAIYSATENTMYVFGGYGGGGSLNDVWALNLATATKTWASISTTGGVPYARYCHTAIYSATENTMYVFGGYGGGRNLNDVWALNLTTKTWAPISTTGGPPGPGMWQTAIYSATENTMYVFGGYGGDVWALNLTTKTWASISTTGGPPVAQHQHTAIYSATENTMYVFGGYGSGHSLNDVWALQA